MDQIFTKIFNTEETKYGCQVVYILARDLLMHFHLRRFIAAKVPGRRRRYIRSVKIKELKICPYFFEIISKVHLKFKIELKSFNKTCRAYAL